MLIRHGDDARTLIQAADEVSRERDAIAVERLLTARQAAVVSADRSVKLLAADARSRQDSIRWTLTFLATLVFSSGFLALRATADSGSRALRALARVRAAEAEAAAGARAFDAIRSSHALVEFRPDGTIADVNERFLELVGFTADKLVGAHHSILVPPEQVSTDAYRQHWVALGAGESRSGIYERRAADGRSVWLQATYSIVTDHEGRPQKILKFAADITHRMEEREVVLRELSDLKAAMDEHSIVAVTDVRGRIVSVNDKFCAISGYEREDLIGKDHRIINSGYHSPGFMKELWHTIARGRVWKGEVKNRAKDGSPYWVDTTIVPCLNTAGKPVRYVAIRTDITQLKANQQSLAAKHAELEATSKTDRIASQVLVAISGADNDEPAEAVLGVLAREAGFRPLAMYRHDPWQGGLLLQTGVGLAASETGRAYQLGEGLVGEAASRREPLFVDDGQHAPFSLDTGVGVIQPATVFALPLVYGDTLLGVIAGASVRPLTVRERFWLSQLCDQVAVGLHATEQYRELRALSQQLNERSRVVEEQNRELARASRLKSEFLASMSHELRTPLNAIIGFSEVLKDGVAGALDQRQNKYTTEIFDNGRHLLALINDILDLSKIESGKMDLLTEPVDVEGAIDTAATTLREAAERGGVTLSTHVSPDVGTIEADARKLRQIVVNLLSNAVKFTPRGGTVRAEATVVGPWVEISVSDTGIGIAEEDQDRLFKAFEQLDGGVTRKYGGTGLGLAMVRSLVQLHSGEFGVESEVDEGSRFWVRLPLTRCHSGSMAVTAAAMQSQRPKPIPFSPNRPAPSVLVIDDDPASIELAERWLGRDGFEVCGAADYASALELMARRTPDVILLDIFLAQSSDGWSCLRALKSSAGSASIPVLIVSISADLQRGLALGAVDVLQKPVPGSDLVRAVRALGLGAPGEPTATVLVVDDDPNAVEHVGARLEEAGLRTVRVTSGAEAIARVAEGGIAAMVLDLMMPDVSGYDVLRAVRLDPATADLPVIVLTAKSLDADDRATLQQSVAHVLSKGGADGDDFVRAVGEAIRTTAVLAGPRHQPEATSVDAVHRPTILVVDDEAPARDLLRLYLEDAGFEVVPAASVAEALERLEHTKPDLITLDLNMPHTDGISFLTQHANAEILRGVPVVVLSGSADPERAMSVGAHAVLSKPILRHALLEVVRNTLEQTVSHRPHVLVVDDEPSALRIVRSYLAEEAFEIVTATSGEEALAAVRERLPDLLILDLMMPGMSGFDVLTQLRTDDATSGLPVIVLSAKNLTSAERRHLAASVQAALTKASTRRADLVEQVRQLIGSNRPACAS